MSSSFTIASVVICTLISLLPREMCLWGQIDAADEKIHGLDAKVLCEEDDSNRTLGGGNGYLK